MIKTKLAKSISMTIASLALSASASSASAHVMYNLFNTPDPSLGTDGWVWGGRGYHLTKDPSGVVNPNNSALANPGFTGTADSNGDGFGDTPFGYVGSSQLNWAAALHHAGDTYTVCGTACGGLANVDTAAGAWMDIGDGVDPNTRTGWKHATDIGLIKADHDMRVTITAEVVGGNAFSNFGMTLFQGMDTNTGGYNHHGAWNANGTPSTNSNPFGTAGVTFLQYDESVDSVNSFSFIVEADTIYSLYLGGNNQLGNWKEVVGDYKLTIATSAVPVPGAMWLFGTAMAGLIGISRRKSA